MNALAKVIVAACASAALFSACALQPSDSAELEISFGSAAPRELDTGWTGGTLPAFESVTVTVTGRGMEPVSRSILGSESSVRIPVPYGEDRLVEIAAVPASGFVESYHGSETIDITRGVKARLTIRILLSETGLLLPSAGSGALYTATSLSGPVSSIGLSQAIDADDDFEFDDRGRVYLASSQGISRLASLSDGTRESLPLAFPVSKGIAYDPSNYRVHYISASSPDELCYVDITRETPQAVIVSRSAAEQRWGQALAAGGGSLYAVIYDSTPDPVNMRVARLTLNEGADLSASYAEVDSAGFDELGLNVSNGYAPWLKAEDMLLKDGVLFVLCSDVYQGPHNETGTLYHYYSRGKVIALSAATLDLLWETGWSGDDNAFPAEPETQFYGPRRIVGIMPRKIFIADDGYSIIGPYGDRSSVNQDRILGIDTGSGAITDLGLSGEVSFFNDFSYHFVC